MAVFIGPFNSGGGASFDETNWRELFGGMFLDGVIKGALNQFAVTAPGGMQVAVDTGYAVLDGVLFTSNASTTLAIAAADPTNPRIDNVIAHIDLVARTGVLQISQGTPAPSPGIVAPVQNSSVWEISLALVTVPAGAAGIVSGNITTDTNNNGGRTWASTKHGHMSFFSGSMVGTGPTTFNHGLGETPNYIVITANSSTPAYFSYNNQNATTVQIYSSVSGAPFTAFAARFP